MKNLKNLGQALSKLEQQTINGGARTICPKTDEEICKAIEENTLWNCIVVSIPENCDQY
ncbi:hypothetical protein [uncultured Olleya sp.]|uniref:hypothetical protein n=1 Tax=uncultured Olleya sp. TaxID=757243 RepID=UPI002597E898|nr:hypothetical protein [uncultured Olleya sp.]